MSNGKPGFKLDKPEIKTPQIKRTEVKLPSTPGGGEDFMSVVKRKAEAAAKNSGQRFVGLIVDDLSTSVPGLSTTFGGVETPTAKRLREARENLAEQRFREAEQLLKEILRETPSHHEARFLMACAQNGKGEYELALRTLAILRQDKITKALLTRILKLCRDVRAAMFNQVMQENLIRLVMGQFDLAIGRLRELIVLDPEAGMYYYLLSGSLMMLRRPKEALAAAEDGLKVADSDERDELTRMRTQLLQVLAREKMAPVREPYQRKQYQLARQVLVRLDSDTQSTPLWRNCDRYLEQCQRGQPQSSASSDFQEAEEVYRFLVENLVDLALPLIRQERYAEAERTITQIVDLLPQYPFGRFLAGHCIYNRVGKQIESGNLPKIDDVLGDFRIAKKHAEAAAVDVEIKGVPDLLEALDDGLKFFEELQVSQKLQEADAKFFDPLIDEFTSIRDLADGGIDSVDQLRQMVRRLESLKARVPDVQRQLRSEGQREMCGKLSETVDRDLSQLKTLENDLQSAEREGLQFQTLAKRFEDKMNELEKQGGIRDLNKLNELKYYMESLKRDIESAKRTMTRADTQKAVSQLLEAVDDVLRQLRH